MGKTDAEVHFSLYDRTKKEERPSTQAKTHDLTTGSSTTEEGTSTITSAADSSPSTDHETDILLTPQN